MPYRDWRNDPPSDAQVVTLTAMTLERFENATEEGVEDWVYGRRWFALDSAQPGIADIDKGPKTKGEVSDKISWTLRHPKLDGSRSAEPQAPREPLPEIPEGRYAVQGTETDDPLDETWRFYRVEVPTKGRYKGRVLLKRGRGGGERNLIWSIIWPHADKLEIMQAIERLGVPTAAKMFGKKSERCWNCGKTLSDPISLSRGIGPDCFKQKGMTP